MPRKLAIPLKSPRDIDAMRRAGALLRKILDDAAAQARIGMTTARVNARIATAIHASGAEPAFGQQGFPGVASITINEEVVHAPPGPRMLREGDVVTIDAALRLNGWCADAARTFILGAPRSAQDSALVAAAARAVRAVVQAIRPGQYWSAVAAHARRIAAEARCALVPEYAGHGIGRSLQEPPAAPFWPDSGGQTPPAGQDFVLRPGMVLTVEPILVLDRPELLGLDDGWTVVTADRSAAAHEECTVAVTGAGALVLTAP
jgi:methionyl aminopeptidase